MNVKPAHAHATTMIDITVVLKTTLQQDPQQQQHQPVQLAHKTGHLLHGKSNHTHNETLNAV